MVGEIPLVIIYVYLGSELVIGYEYDSEISAR